WSRHFIVNDPVSTDVYPLSLHDALPIFPPGEALPTYLEQVSLITDIDSLDKANQGGVTLITLHSAKGLEFPVVFIAGVEEGLLRSEEHTSELQSRENLVCRLLLEKKKRN